MKKGGDSELIIANVVSVFEALFIYFNLILIYQCIADWRFQYQSMVYIFLLCRFLMPQILLETGEEIWLSTAYNINLRY